MPSEKHGSFFLFMWWSHVRTQEEDNIASPCTITECICVATMKSGYRGRYALSTHMGPAAVPVTGSEFIHCSFWPHRELQ